MKKELHPDYVDATVKCSCGNTFQTRATVPNIAIEICNACHPFYTGTQKLVDSGGRVQRFSDRFGTAAADLERKAKATKAEKAAEIAAQMAAIAEARAAKQERKAKKSAEFAKKLKKEAAKAEAESTDDNVGESSALPEEPVEDTAATEPVAETNADVGESSALPEEPAEDAAPTDEKPAEDSVPADPEHTKDTSVIPAEAGIQEPAADPAEPETKSE